MANKRKIRPLKVDLLDPDKFVKERKLKEVTNPVFFVRDNIPTDDGLLSNAIFGITKTERASTYAYINLGGTFIHPLCYKIMCKLDSNIKALVHGTKNFKIDSTGKLVEDPTGKTGIDFLEKNIDKIKFRESESGKRSRNIIFIEKNKKNLFMHNMIVIPAYYRDVNSSDGYSGVGEINELYSGLIIASRSLRELKDYGFDDLYAAAGRVQEQLLEIYTWFSDGPVVNGTRNGNLSKKFGIMRRAVMSKTIDYGSRLVISSPNIKAEKYNELMVDMKHSAVPLASVIVNFYPFVLFHLRRMVENEFMGATTYPAVNDKGEIEYLELDNPMEKFSDAELKRQMDIYIHSYDNRLVPIDAPVKSKKPRYMHFKGYKVPPEDFAKKEKDPSSYEVISRRLTWCDLLYQAAVEATKDKMVLISRYPIDSYFNQFATKCIVSTTINTTPILLDNQFYRWYPQFSDDMIGTSTGSMFIDTLQICNGYLKGAGADYDGDQCSCRGVYTVEANEELEKTMYSKKHYITLGSTTIRVAGHEAIQSMFEMTLTLPDNKLTNPVF